jgi:hypothetical protein
MIVTPIIIPVSSEPSWCEKNDCRCPCHSEPSRDWPVAIGLLILIVAPFVNAYLQFSSEFFSERPYSDNFGDRVFDALMVGFMTFVVLLIASCVIAGVSWAIATIWRSIVR